MQKKFPKNTFGKRMSSMLRTDSRRMFMTPLFYIMLGIAVAVPILILVMTTMMDGSVSVDPNTGKETVMEAFDSTWQIIGTASSSGGSEKATEMSMDMMSMCNINLLYFGVAVLISLFVSADFKSGYAKNLFTVRAKKTDYIISKTVIGFIAAAILVFGFFVGTVIGGGIAGLPFTMDGFTSANLVMCMLTKILLMAVFVPIYVMANVIAKQKTWLGMVISLAVGMLLFSMIPMISPITATAMNVVLCLAGGVLFSFGFGAISKAVLNKKDIL